MAANTNVKSVAIQSFSLKTSSEPEDGVQKLAKAMSQFKASSEGKIERAFLGKISDSVVEQIFLLNSPIDTAKPFLPFTTPPEQLAVSTVVPSNHASLSDSLYAPLTETIVQDLVPGTDLDVLSKGLESLGESIRSWSGGYGSAYGFVQQEGKTKIVVVNGWENHDRGSEWLANLNEVNAAYFQALVASLGGSVEPTFKHITEIE
ncbi:hypothetical protein AAF712_014096 [Marasmius tenuissimus]|uniref:Uncharacterized protein n=1 Tax=Marasmius tenuissimus TaxID=585030 RepID=A0ABR2ZCZ5_9AGAR